MDVVEKENFNPGEEKRGELYRGGTVFEVAKSAFKPVSRN